MKYDTNVIHIEDLRKKRRQHSLRAWFSVPMVVASLFLIGICSILVWAYRVDVTNNPSHGFNQAKENLQNFQTNYPHK